MAMIARIERKGARFLESIQITLTESEDRTSGRKSWRGSFWCPMSENFQSGRDFHLVLQDRRRGRAIVDSTTIGSGSTEQSVSFVGTRPLK